MDTPSTPPDIIFSVSEFIESLNAALKQLHAKIIGEIIKVTHAASGHVYFTLRDKHSDAVIECIMWKYVYQVNGLRLENGIEIIITGNPNVYAQQGRLSFHAKTAELVGEGALKKAYEKLKQTLTQEGLLDSKRKRPLPEFPQKIGIITSQQGAVIHNFENNISKRGYKLKLFDTRVEGKEALLDVLSSLKRMHKEDIDILILMRGGGSFQALATFDNEAVVRAIASFPVPVIAAIGHHQDVPLAALVADAAVSTPTAAANLLDTSWDAAEKAVRIDEQLIVNAYAERINEVTLTLQLRKEEIAEKFGRILFIFHDAQSQLKIYLSRMHETLYFQKTVLAEQNVLIRNSFKRDIDENKQRLPLYFTQLPFQSVLTTTSQQLISLWNTRLHRSYSYAISESAKTLTHSNQLIAIHNPLRLLQQGYSVIRQGGRIVKATKDVTIGDSIELLISDGTVYSTVTQTKNKQ